MKLSTKSIKELQEFIHNKNGSIAGREARLVLVRHPQRDFGSRDFWELRLCPTAEEIRAAAGDDSKLEYFIFDIEEDNTNAIK